MNYKKYMDTYKYIDVLNISIDGYNEETQFIRDKGIMPKIIKNITFLREKVSVNLIATIHAKNVRFTDEYIKLSKDLGVQLSFSIFTVDPNDETFKDYIFDNRSLLDFSNKILSLDQNIPIFDTPVGEVELTCKGNCEVGKEIISIGADGSIYPCHMLHDSSLELGNILNVSLEEALNNCDNPFSHLDVDNINECMGCQYKYLCGGGCRGRSWLYHKTLYNKDSYCSFIKNFYIDSIIKLKASVALIES
jgi:radical SAM protein with 4Fe4S-binding SPASM domain